MVLLEQADLEVMSSELVEFPNNVFGMALEFRRRKCWCSTIW